MSPGMAEGGMPYSGKSLLRDLSSRLWPAHVNKAHHFTQSRLQAWALVMLKQSFFLLRCKAERWLKFREWYCFHL